MSEEEQKPTTWWAIGLRHFTTFVIIMGAIWWLATPRVEAFVMEVVNERMTKIERRMDIHTQQLSEILRVLRDMVNER